jgi:hypothetical protein
LHPEIQGSPCKIPKSGGSGTDVSATAKEKDSDARQPLRCNFPATKGANFDFQSNRPGILPWISLHNSTNPATVMLQARYSLPFNLKNEKNYTSQMLQAL